MMGVKRKEGLKVSFVEAYTGPGNIPIYVISGFFDFGGFVSAGFLGMKCPHMYSDLGLLVLYTCTFGYNIKIEKIGRAHV